jgi:hypothetical protein
MAKFDQRGQHVTYQYNADKISFDGLKDRHDLASALQELHSESQRALEEGALAGVPGGAEAAHHIGQAAVESARPGADKATILDHLSKAKTLLEGFAALGGFVEAISKAATIVHNLF